jgi:hypothetical protein
MHLVGTEGIGFCIQKWKMGEASYGFCLCVLVAKALGFLLMVGASLYMVGVVIPPIFALDVVDGLTEFDDEICEAYENIIPIARCPIPSVE